MIVARKLLAAGIPPAIDPRELTLSPILRSRPEATDDLKLDQPPDDLPDISACLVEAERGLISAP
jgi:hypothetical protein